MKNQVETGCLDYTDRILDCVMHLYFGPTHMYEMIYRYSYVYMYMYVHLYEMILKFKYSLSTACTL